MKSAAYKNNPPLTERVLWLIIKVCGSRSPGVLTPLSLTRRPFFLFYSLPPIFNPLFHLFGFSHFLLHFPNVIQNLPRSPLYLFPLCPGCRVPLTHILFNYSPTADCSICCLSNSVLQIGKNSLDKRGTF